MSATANESRVKMTEEQKELYFFITTCEPFSSRYDKVITCAEVRRITAMAIADYEKRYGNGKIFSNEDLKVVSNKIIQEVLS